MRHLLSLLCALNACAATACIMDSSGVSGTTTSWSEAAPRIASALCSRCVGDGFEDDSVSACEARLLAPGQGLTPGPGEQTPDDVEECRLRTCEEDLAVLDTCNGFRMPDSCLSLVFGPGNVPQ